ncbi:ent-kaurenoic acid oxidase-like [Lolium rigidum]|uniref:ent-kaurenoic acid oxidase-like n=1 Tax=Lolium rigidum TaxID=89674 RepID=UPI001F5C45FF|nr:ent-kaurenoic acid oxidase-like [Lolium rigidum]
MAISWAWLLGAVPLLFLAFWHATDAWYRAAFFLKHGKKSLPPGHMGVPFLGETLSLLWYFKHARRPDEFISAKKTAYGKAAGMYRTHLFGSPTIIACTPAANKFVLQSPENFGVQWPEPELVGHTSVVNVEGATHTRLRGFILAAINSPRSLRTIAAVVQPRVVAALASWADKGTIVAATEIKRVTFANICMMFISMEPSPLTEKIDEWFGNLVAGLRSFPLDFPGTTFHRARKCRRKLNAVFREELQARRKKAMATEAEDDDVMGGFMRMEDEQGKKLSDDEVVDNIVSLVVAGYESTASAITWATYHLAKSTDALSKLREENLTMRESKGGLSFITHDDIPKMKYTAKVVEETIRMANIAPMAHRVAKKEVEYNGYTIPKGWPVLVWVRSLHTDPNNFQDPLTFNPDRWDEPAKPGTYQVFGGGYRVCAGNMLARLQLTIMLHHLSIGYEWELLNPDAEISYLPHPKPVDGVAMTFRKLATK